MIGYLRGEVLEHTEGRMLFLVGGVGYAVCVPTRAAYLSLVPGKASELHVYTHVREDSLDLFGFTSHSEKEIFLTLLSVNGVGPKMALGILSRVEPDELIRAVVENDKDSLTRIPGIGKKTAERIVLELGDKIRKKLEAGDFGSARPTIKTPETSRHAAGIFQDAFQDAKIALIGLGYREHDVATLLQRALSESENPPKKADELVKFALRQLL